MNMYDLYGVLCVYVWKGGTCCGYFGWNHITALVCLCLAPWCQVLANSYNVVADLFGLGWHDQSIQDHQSGPKPSCTQ